MPTSSFAHINSHTRAYCRSTHLDAMPPPARPPQPHDPAAAVHKTSYHTLPCLLRILPMLVFSFTRFLWSCTIGRITTYARIDGECSNCTS